MPRNTPLTPALHRSLLKALLLPSVLLLSHLWPCAPLHLPLHCAPSGHKALPSLSTPSSPPGLKPPAPLLNSSLFLESIKTGGFKGYKMSFRINQQLFHLIISPFVWLLPEHTVVDYACGLNDFALLDSSQRLFFFFLIFLYFPLCIFCHYF